jgi:hypothetical protein
MNETPSSSRLLLPYFILALTMAAFSLDAPGRLSASLNGARQHRAALASAVNYPVLPTGF